MQNLRTTDNWHDENLITVAKSIYSGEAIRSASICFAAEARISIEELDSHSWGLRIDPKSSTVALNDIATRLLEKLLEIQTNIDLNERFGSIRNMIVEAAFSPLKRKKPS